ncbi:MAG: DNA cytosine methyltransferase [Alphaproteobacteria bacterium]|nr:DNA cytosine methyltransferase [Alphaproteobacteria bacterium]
MTARSRRTAYEFFAGGGMARIGLGPGWTCLLANDIDPKKAAAYRANFGDADLIEGDIAALTAADLPGAADLAWASFPCQDLSLAGLGGGLAGARSGTVFGFWRLIRDLMEDRRAPRLIALENVCGALTSHGGADFARLIEAFAETGYAVGALVIDASRFTPQSRPRLFLVGLRDDAPRPADLLADAPEGPFHTRPLIRAVHGLPKALREAHLWWRLAPPPGRGLALSDILDTDEAALARARLGPARTSRLIGQMSPIQRARLAAIQAQGVRTVGAVFRRTRRGGDGERLQRAEARFDGLAGCLRTPGGGSSRQLLLEVEGPRLEARRLTPRETARLMGLPDSYRLPAREGEALHVTGDGVAAPVVAHLARRLFEPLLRAADAAAPARPAAAQDA